MKHTKPGPLALKEFIDRVGCQKKALARAAGIDPAMVARFLSGDRRPNLDVAARLEVATLGMVPAISWARQGGEG